MKLRFEDVLTASDGRNFAQSPSWPLDHEHNDYVKPQENINRPRHWTFELRKIMWQPNVSREVRPPLPPPPTPPHPNPELRLYRVVQKTDYIACQTYCG